MVALWGRKLEDPSRLFLQRYETRSLYGASSRGILVKYYSRIFLIRLIIIIDLLGSEELLAILFIEFKISGSLDKEFF